MNVPGSPFVFPKWTNAAPLVIGAGAALLPLYVIALLMYGTTAPTVRIGYMPQQPVPYSHKLHAGELGIDCRYCHNTVETAGHAAVPPTQTCMNCHSAIHPESEKLAPVRESYATGEPVHWVRVHDVPDFVFFNHSAHVTRGVPCIACHGRVDKMEEVYQAKALTMGWCLDCHRAPEQYLRDPEFVTDMNWVAPGDPVEYGKEIRKKYKINPPDSCSTCHR